MSDLVGPGCLISSDFGTPNHLEAVLFSNGTLWHYYSEARGGSEGRKWIEVKPITTKATGPGGLIQSDFGSNHGNFEVVALEGNELVHYFLDNHSGNAPWQRAQVISTKATGPGCIIQSDFGSNHGNFEVVVPEGNLLVHYFLDNYGGASQWQRVGVITGRATGPGCIIQSDFGSQHGNFEVVVLEGRDLVHYFLDNAGGPAQWQRVGVVTDLASGAGSIIQGYFGSGHKNFEVVVLEENELVHYFLDNSAPVRTWKRGQVVSVASGGPGCIARGTRGANGPLLLGERANYEVLAAEVTRSVVHYVHHNTSGDTPWWRSSVLRERFAEPYKESPHICDTKKIAQLTGEEDRQLKQPTRSRTHSRYGVTGTDLGQAFEHDGRLAFLFGDTNVDGVIRTDDGLARDSIAFCSDTVVLKDIELKFNPSAPKVDDIVQNAFCVPTDGISFERKESGPGWIIRSTYGLIHRNFEVVVLQGQRLNHWWHDNTDVRTPWQCAQTISTQATGPGCIMQSDFGSGHGNFEVVVLEGHNLVHYFLVNSGGPATWQRAGIITAQATGPGCIIQSDFGSDHRNFEVVVLEGNELVHYFRDNSGSPAQWQRAGVITDRATGPGCIIQSDFGSEHGNFEVVVLEGNQLVHYFLDNYSGHTQWQRGRVITDHASGPGCIMQSDFKGGDHGNFEVVVPEGDQLAHYFHDNANLAGRWQRGHTVARGITDAGCIIQSDFGSGHGNFEVVVPVGGRLQHFFHDNANVALPWSFAQQVTNGSSMFVFFTTGRIASDSADDFVSMHRSVLARSEDNGLNFGTSLYELSREKFINVSLQRLRNFDHPGLPEVDGEGILIFGSGGYRRSNIYLAHVPLNRLEDRSAIRYFAGSDASSRPLWGRDEASARPLFLSGSVGEFGVRWNPFISRFVMLYNGDNPYVVLEHQSPHPWGPWSGPENILDMRTAFGQFIHEENKPDGLSDPCREDKGGGVYAPYLIERFTTPNHEGSTTMYFAMSVWNPYNVMLMSATVRARG
ncbi:MAG: DUF4185 domain-containing protein [Flavobacteriales bacterium]|nr:DUF4185 domain-containing protein [Flavobacteriales bacterium]